MPNDTANNMADAINQLEKELKDLKEENKVLTNECDRLIKEKGELLNKVSGGDVLRICQLEEQIKDWKEEYANLNKISYGFYEELKEAKRLLKSATGIIKDVDCNEDYLCDECEYRAKCDGGFSFYWHYANEAENLLNDEK